MMKEQKLLFYATFLIEVYYVKTGAIVTDEPFQETSSMFLNGEMTFEDLFGHLNYSHLYHPYTFNSGVGNREDLIIDEIQKDLSFRAGKGVVNWTKLKLKNALWLAGIKPSGVTVIKIVGIDIQTYRVEERFIDVPDSKISSIFLFDVWNKRLRSKEPILMIANHTVESGRCDNDVLWYRIDGPSIEKIWHGPSMRIGKHLTVIKHKHDFNLIFANKASIDSLAIQILRLSFSDGKPEISFLQNLPLNHRISSLTATEENGNLYLLAVNKDDEEVVIYKYEPFCPDIPEGRFAQHQKISSKGVTQATAFNVGNRNYFVLNGHEADIYVFDHLAKVSPTRKPSTWTPLEFVHKWIVLSVMTFRNDVIMLAQHDTTVSILTWSGSLNGFTVKRQPPCVEVNQKLEKIGDISNDLSCLTHFSWEGATLIDIGHVPTIVFAGHSGFSFMYHIICTLVPVYNPEWDLLKLEYLLRRIEEKWLALKNRLDVLGIKAGSNSKRTGTFEDDIEDVVSLVDSPIPKRNLTELQQRLIHIIKSLDSIEYKIKEKENWMGQNNVGISVNYKEKEISNKSNQVTISLQGYFKFQKPISVDKLPLKKIPIVTNNKYWNVSGDLIFITEKEEEITYPSEDDGGRPLVWEGENREPQLIDIRFYGDTDGEGGSPPGSASLNSQSAPNPYSSWPSQPYYPPVEIEPGIGIRKPKLMTMGAPYEPYYGNRWYYPYSG